MGWMSRVVLLVVLRYITLSFGIPSSPQDSYIVENALTSDVDSNVAVPPENKLAPINVEEDTKLQRLTNYLTYMLLRPWPVTGLPLLYVEDYPAESEYPGQEEELSEFDESLGSDNQVMSQTPYKRSRYYRKYPWKRQNSREAYEAENRYLCQPSKDDVFRLLVALHEARQGNRGHTIHFCNRKRPASAIFTNIRFLGKRK